MKTADNAALIRHALSSNHFQGFWPGADNKSAISTATSGSGGWGGPSGWGQLTKTGIETYPSLDDLRAGTNGECITWREILDVIRRGLTPENRERYEAASAAYFEQSRAPLPEPRPIGVRTHEAGEPDPYFESEANQARWAKSSDVARELDDATMAIPDRRPRPSACAGGAVVNRPAQGSGGRHRSLPSIGQRRRSATLPTVASWAEHLTAIAPTPPPSHAAVALCSGREGDPIIPPLRRYSLVKALRTRRGRYEPELQTWSA